MMLTYIAIILWSLQGAKAAAGIFLVFTLLLIYLNFGYVSKGAKKLRDAILI